MATRIDKVTIEYELDYILLFHWTTLNGKLMKAADALREETHVRTWYKDHYPNDPKGDDLEGQLSWAVMLERMRNKENLYSIIGVSDSVVRERLFSHLAELMLVPYEVICRIWLY